MTRCCQLGVASLPLPSHLYQHTSAKLLQDNSIRPIRCGSRAETWAGKRVRGWAEHRAAVAAGGFPREEELVGREVSGHSAEWWQLGASHFHTPCHPCHHTKLFGVQAVNWPMPSNNWPVPCRTL